MVSGLLEDHQIVLRKITGERMFNCILFENVLPSLSSAEPPCLHDA